MKKTDVIWGLLPLFIVGCHPTPKSYRISGKVTEPQLNGKMLYLSKPVDGQLVNIDSVKIENDAFEFTGVQDTPEVCYLQFGRNIDVYAPLILENGNLAAVIGAESKVTGGKLNDRLSAFLAKCDEINAKKQALTQEFFAKRNSNSLTQEDEKQLIEKYNALDTQTVDLGKKYISSNLDNVSGAFVLSMFSSSFEDNELEEIIEKSGPAFRNEPQIKQLAEKLENMKTVAIGKPFVDMTLETPEGTPGKLSDYAGKGKYTIVDFWASWCGPCRAAMPELIAIYNEYKDKGVDVVGISLDTNREAWINAIEALQIPWPQLSDLKGWKAAATTVYGINSIPNLMLINPDGTIAARGLYDDTLRKKLEEIFD